MHCSNCLLLLLALAVGLAAGAANAEPTAAEAERGERPKRGAITLDFGLLLRSLLQKSADLSSVKVNVTRNLINAKTTRRPAARPMATRTTTAAPPPPPPRRRPRPYYGPGWWPRPYDFYPPQSFDYDYGDTAPSTAAAPTARPPATAAPRPQRVRPPPRPLGHLYYDYDYDYEAPRPRTRPRPRPTSTPSPPPPPPPPPSPSPPPPPPRRAPRPQQLADQLVYQYAQPADTYSKPRSFADAVQAAAAAAAAAEAAAGGSEAEAEPEPEPEPEADPAEPATNDDNLNGPAEGELANAPPPSASDPFLVNYPEEPRQSLSYRPFVLPAGGSAYLGFNQPSINRYPAPGLPHSSYYLN